MDLLAATGVGRDINRRLRPDDPLAGADVVTLRADLADRTLAITIGDGGADRTVHDLHDLSEAVVGFRSDHDS